MKLWRGTTVIKGRLARITTGAVSLAILSAGLPLQPLAAQAASTTTYTATETIPVPPASNYAGAGGGDGWSIALSNTQVFNVFHHNPSTQLSCHNQSDASGCYPVRTITDGSGNNFATSGHPGMFLDQNTGKLYTYGTRGSDSTAGVICIDTTIAATNPNPFCGYTALTAVNDSPLSSGISGLSTPMQVGTKWFAFNFVNGSAAGAGAGGQNTLLCFDLTTFGACAGQPIPVNIGAGTVGVNSFPTPATASIGAQIVIPIVTGGNPLLACWDASTGTNCSGSWPAAAPISYPGNAGAPFAELDPTGKLIGLCLPTGTDECYSLIGASVATPPGMIAAIGSGSVSWDGTGLVLGPRVYVPAWTNVVYCYDSSTSSSCANFPKFFNNLSLLYTVNPDPRRPTCIWVNADNGSAQIQNFDAYSGGACGSGPIRVLASSIVVPTQLCTPFTYTSLQVLSPAPSSYTSGTVAFEDTDGNPIAGTPILALDATGTVSLTGLSLNTALGLPEFLITLSGASTRPTSVTVQLTWTGVSDPSCVPSGVPGPSAPQNLKVTLGNANATLSWQPPANNNGAPIQSYTAVAQPVYNNRLSCNPDGSHCNPLPLPPTLSITCPGSLWCNGGGSPATSATFNNLLADCHQLYRFGVYATDANGSSTTTYSDQLRPSGIVAAGKQPPYVLILLDGIGESKPFFGMNPYQPTPPESIINGASSNCPEEWNGTSEVEANFNGTPGGPWEFMNKWNYADPGGNTSLSCSDSSGNAAASKCSNSTPRALDTETPTNAFMLDALAGQGAVILPYSYQGATLSGSVASPHFNFPAYSWCDSTPPGVPGPPSSVPSCSGRQPIAKDVSLLNAQITSIRAVWPTSTILIMGHSQGGLVAWSWWLKDGSAQPGLVSQVFTLDSPINGVCTSAACLGPIGYPPYSLRDIFGKVYLKIEGAAGNPVRFIGTQGDTVPTPPFGFGAYGPSGAENLQHELLVTGDNCSFGGNQSDCPAPPDHVSGCDIDTNGPYGSTTWIQDDQHFITKFCPDNVTFFNGILRLSY
jgi:hypothetical protein